MKTLIIFINLVSIGVHCLSQEEKNIDLFYILSKSKELNVMKMKFSLPKNEPLYFLGNEFTPSNTSYQKDIKFESGEFFIENFNHNIFYVQNIILNKDLAIMDLSFRKQYSISINFRRDSKYKWFISNIDFKRSMNFKDSPVNFYFNKVSYIKSRQICENIRKINFGTSVQDVRKIMKNNNDLEKEFYYKTIDANDTLLVLKYHAIGYYDEHIIYFDNENKVNAIKFAKDSIKHILESNKN